MACMKDLISNRYRITDKLGQGGMGIVYLVEDSLKDNMLFALKTIRQDVLSKMKEIGIKSFKNEYEMMTRLKHPNLAQVYEFGNDSDNYFIVMEYLEGILLSEYLMTDFDKNRINDILVQILRALEYIHSRNIMYRDIKPGNIMVDGTSVKLMDFGLAGFELKGESKVKGTMQYFSPEAINKKVGYSMDIFSLGLVYFEMLTGEMFFSTSPEDFSGIINMLYKRDKYMAFMKKRLNLVKDTDTRNIVRRMIEYSPKDRYQACSEVISDINQCSGRNYEFETSETKESYVLGNAFADRKDEFRELKTQLAKADDQHFFVYNGNVGVGKTRLFIEFKKYCRLGDILFFDSSCMEGEIREYHYFGDILLQMMTYSSDELLGRAGPYLKLMLPDSDRLSRFRPPQIMDNPMMLKEITIQNIIDYIIEFYGEIQKRFVIYFNDLQWIDDGSAVLLEALLSRLNINSGINICIYANINEEKIKSRVVRSMLENAGIRIHDLGPLDGEGISEYIENVFGSRFIDRSISESVQFIKEKVGGNPLFLEELIKSLIESNVIIKDNRYWKLLKPAEGIEIPRNLLDTVRTRVKRILKDRNREHILHILALLRVDLPIETLIGMIRKICGIEPAKALIELERMEILQQHSVENYFYYSFTSSIIKDIVNRSVKERKSINLDIARNMEAMIGDSGQYNEEIAYHYIEAEVNDRALFFCRKCADNARKDYFHEKAVKYYDIMLYSLNLSIIDERLEIMLCKARSLEVLGRWDEALSVLDDCRKHASDAGKQIILAQINSLSGRIYLQKGEINKAKKAFDLSLEISENTGNKALIAESYDNLGSYFYNQSLMDEAMKYHSKNRDYFLRAGDRSGYLRALNNIGNIHFARSNYTEAIECFKKCQYIALELHDKKSIGNAVGNQGNVYYNQGNFAKAFECYEIDRDLSEEIGDKRGTGIACGNLGSACSSLGDYAKALHYYNIYKKISEELGDKKGTGAASGNLGSIYYFQGKTSKALSCFKEYKRISEEINDQDGIKNAALNIGNIYYYQGRLKKALKNYRLSAGIARKTGDKRGLGIAGNNIGNIYKEQGNYRQSISFFESGREIFEEIGDKMAAGITDVNIGIAYAETGDFEQAFRQIEKACSIFDKTGDRHASANAFGSLGNVCYLAGEYDKALLNYDKSLGIFREIGIKDPDIIDYLLKSAEILLRNGSTGKAAEANKKAMKLAEELENEEYINRARIQGFRVLAVNDRVSASASLLKLLENARDEEAKAMIYYELYFIEGKNQYREKAIRSYRSLYEKHKKFSYKKAMQELKAE